MAEFQSLEELLGGALRAGDGRVAVCQCPHCGGPIILPQVLEMRTIEELKAEYPVEEGANEGDQGRS